MNQAVQVRRHAQPHPSSAVLAWLSSSNFFLLSSTPNSKLKLPQAMWMLLRQAWSSSRFVRLPCTPSFDQFQLHLLYITANNGRAWFSSATLRWWPYCSSRTRAFPRCSGIRRLVGRATGRQIRVPTKRLLPPPFLHSIWIVSAIYWYASQV